MTAALVERLLQHRDAAFLARELTRIRCDMPLEVVCGQLRRKRPDLDGIDSFCAGNGFGMLLRRQAERLFA